MNIVLLALIALVLLFGLIAIGAGHRGWSWGTVTGAILLLLAATGYFYLAARLADRERSWRTKVSKNETEIAKIRDGTAAAAGDSLADLRSQRDRWERVQTFVETWRGRSWKATGFSPPRGGKPGSISVEMPSEESGQSPVNVGAELAVFDNAKFEDGGRFLGIFRVLSAEANKGDATCLMTVAAADAPTPPSQADTALWSRDYDDVTVFENLPVDRWMAFQTLTGAATPPGDAAGDSTTARWLPQPRQTADDRLRQLEEQMKHPKHHDDVIPEEEWKAVGDQLAAGEIPQGSLWAVVEFEENVKFTKKGGFALYDTAPSDAPAEAASEDDDEGPVGAPGEMAAPGEMMDPGADGGGEGSAGVASRRFTSKQFAKGSQAEFDYQTALALQDDKHWCRIKSVIYRRPLSDPFTALRGGSQSEGIYKIRQAMLSEIAAIEQNTKRVEAARGNADAQAESVAEEKRQVAEDLDSWQKDVAAAGKTAVAFDERLREATLELGGLEAAIVRLGRELSGASATLTQTIDASAPPPVRQR